MRLPFNGSFRITQTFGNVLYLNGINWYAQWGLNGHNGQDYGLPNGTEVIAPHSGTIKEYYFDANGYGWYIKLENDIEGSVLAHLMNKPVVKMGDVVKEGDLIAYSNNTGGSTGPHLHWGYYRFPRNRQNGFNGFVDQTPYLENEPEVSNNSITDYLVSVGYIYPEAHLNVVKVLHESDLKLKSGLYIESSECSRKVEEAVLQKEVELNKIVEEKEKLINNLQNEVKKLKVSNEELQKEKAGELVKLIEEIETSIKKTTEYKVGSFLVSLFSLKKRNSKSSL
jgi:hypothetical protein